MTAPRRFDGQFVGSVGLTVVAVAMLIGSLAVAELRLDDFGLVGSLPLPYLVGLALLPLASVLELGRGANARPWMIVLQVVLFIVIVWITPTILEGTPRFRTSYVNYGYVDPIVRGDGLLPGRFIYHNWPLFPILMAGVVAAGIDPLTLMLWFPLVAMLLYLVPLAAIVIMLGRASEQRAFRRAAAANDALQPLADATPDGPPTEPPDGSADAGRRTPPYWALALWFFPIFDWTGQDYFSPQAFAYGIFLVWLIALIRVSLRADGRFTPRTLAIVVGLFTIITSTHLLTALLGLGILFTLVLTRLLRQWTVFVTCAVIFLVWQVYVAAPFFEFYRSQLLETILDLPNFLESNFSNRIRGSEGHALVAQVRVLVTVVAFGVGAIGAALMARRRGGNRTLRFVVAYVLGVALVAPVTVYGGEMLIRSLLFVLPVLAGVAAICLRERGFLLLATAVLVVMAPIHVITHYGNELYDYVSPGEIAAFEYIEARGPANVYGGAPAGAFENTARLDTRNSTVPKSGGVAGLAGYERPADHAWAREEWPIYVVVSRGDDAAMRLFQDITGFRASVEAMATANRGFQRVFEHEDVTVYLWTPPAATTR